MAASLIESIFLENRPLLDVRAPIEFAKGAFPQSVNLPILSDQQREQVGICYKKHGSEQAIQLGHRLIDEASRKDKVRAWSDFISTNPNGYLYCFRGGQRSEFARQWLREIRVDYPHVPGGYKTMRAYLTDQLARYSSTLPFTLISGKTGSGKTELLTQLPHHVDLEALANHRGSSFGANLTPQPTTISFENCLAINFLQLARLNPHTIYLEDEGKLIGSLAIPLALRNRMLTLPCVLLVETLDKRIRLSAKVYIAELFSRYCASAGEDRGTELFIRHHKAALKKIEKRFGHEQIRLTEQKFDYGMDFYRQEGRIEGFDDYIGTLLTNYYDPMYEYQFKSKNRTVLFTGNASEVIDWCSQLSR